MPPFVIDKFTPEHGVADLIPAPNGTLRFIRAEYCRTRWKRVFARILQFFFAQNPENAVDTAQLPKLNSKDLFLSSRSVYVPGEDNISLAKVPNWYRYIDVRMKAASFQILDWNTFYEMPGIPSIYFWFKLPVQCEAWQSLFSVLELELSKVR